MKKKDHTPYLLRFMRFIYPKLEWLAPWLSQYLFRLVFYVPLRYKIPEKEKEAAASAEWFTLNVLQKKIQCYAWGQPNRPYVLFVHGWAGRALQFRKFFQPLLASDYRVIAFDGPAHGRSEGRKTSILEFEAVLQEIVRKLGVPHAVVTHSFGGGAVLFAAMRGLPVRRLVNVASPTIADEILKTFLRAINGTWTSAERFKKFVQKNTGSPFEHFTGMYAVKRLPSPFPILLVHDEDDQDVYIIHARTLMAEYPLAQLYLTRGLGHTRILKDEGAIQATLDFIRKGA